MPRWDDLLDISAVRSPMRPTCCQSSAFLCFGGESRPKQPLIAVQHTTIEPIDRLAHQQFTTYHHSLSLDRKDNTSHANRDVQRSEFRH